MRHEMFFTPPGRTVSATEFVRHFAQYKRVSDAAPVYIEAHGKPGWALVSTAMLDAMARGGAGDEGLEAAAAQLDVLLDTMNTRALLLDEDMVIRRVNPAFLRHARVSPEVAIGKPLAAMLKQPALDIVCDSVERVISSATTEVFEMDSTMNPGRVLQVSIARVPGGVAVLADDVTHPIETAGLRAESSALRVAAGVLPGLCVGRLNLRGGIEGADLNLSQLSGIAADALLGTRLGTLFDMSSRARVNELVDQTLDGGPPGWTRARLLSRGAEMVSVTLALAAVRGRAGPTGAAFIVQDRSPPAPEA